MVVGRRFVAFQVKTKPGVGPSAPNAPVGGTKPAVAAPDPAAATAPPATAWQPPLANPLPPHDGFGDDGFGALRLGVAGASLGLGALDPGKAVEGYPDPAMQREIPFAADQPNETFEVEQAGTLLDPALDGRALSGLPDGTFVYLITSDGHVAYNSRAADLSANPFEPGARYVATHRSLFRMLREKLGKDVKVVAAGEIRVLNGRIVVLNNKAGTFRGGATSLEFAGRYLPRFGLDIEDNTAWINLAAQEVTSASGAPVPALNDHSSAQWDALLRTTLKDDPAFARLVRLMRRAAVLHPDPAKPGVFKMDMGPVLQKLFKGATADEVQDLAAVFSSNLSEGPLSVIESLVKSYLARRPEGLQAKLPELHAQLEKFANTFDLILQTHEELSRLTVEAQGWQTKLEAGPLATRDAAELQSWRARAVDALGKMNQDILASEIARGGAATFSFVVGLEGAGLVDDVLTILSNDALSADAKARQIALACGKRGVSTAVGTAIGTAASALFPNAVALAGAPLLALTAWNLKDERPLQAEAMGLLAARSLPASIRAGAQIVRSLGSLSPEVAARTAPSAAEVGLGLTAGASEAAEAGLFATVAPEVGSAVAPLILGAIGDYIYRESYRSMYAMLSRQQLGADPRALLSYLDNPDFLDPEKAADQRPVERWVQAKMFNKFLGCDFLQKGTWGHYQDAGWATYAQALDQYTDRTLANVDAPVRDRIRGMLGRLRESQRAFQQTSTRLMNGFEGAAKRGTVSQEDARALLLSLPASQRPAPQVLQALVRSFDKAHPGARVTREAFETFFLGSLYLLQDDHLSPEEEVYLGRQLQPIARSVVLDYLPKASRPPERARLPIESRLLEGYLGMSPEELLTRLDGRRLFDPPPTDRRSKEALQKEAARLNTFITRDFLQKGATPTALASGHSDFASYLDDIYARMPWFRPALDAYQAQVRARRYREAVNPDAEVPLARSIQPLARQFVVDYLQREGALHVDDPPVPGLFSMRHRLSNPTPDQARAFNDRVWSSLACRSSFREFLVRQFGGPDPSRRDWQKWLELFCTRSVSEPLPGDREIELAKVMKTVVDEYFASAYAQNNG